MVQSSWFDAGVFEALFSSLQEAELLASSSSPDDGSGRNGMIQIAPYDGGGLPGLSQFRQVRCKDLTGRGLSFVSRTPPVDHCLAVALGDAPHVFLVAIVDRFKQLHDDHQTGYLVDCRFVRRFDQDTLPAK